MKTTRLSLIGGTAAGAAAMYLLDPLLGRRRRAVVRDKLFKAASKSGHALRPTARDVYNRAYGTVAEAKSRLRKSDDVSDDALVARVRSALGRFVNHPRAISVTASDGCVTLSGPVLATEERTLIKHVSRIPGVKSVATRLEVHDQADDVPGLQGGSRRIARLDIAQENWAPATRLFSSVAGALLGLYGAQRRGVRGFALSALGLGLFTRAATNLEAKRLAGLRTGRGGTVDVQKTLTIDAPVDRVFALWTDYANSPRFMSNVREVKDLGGGRSHWIVAGPAGIPVEWDAVVTESVPNEVLAWRTEPGSVVHHTGVIRFEPAGSGTRVHVRLSYTPPAGALGHVVAKLFGADPKSEIDADLLRMKSFVESGRPPHDAARPQRSGARENTAGGLSCN